MRLYYILPTLVFTSFFVIGCVKTSANSLASKNSTPEDIRWSFINVGSSIHYFDPSVPNTKSVFKGVDQKMIVENRIDESCLSIASCKEKPL